MSVSLNSAKKIPSKKKVAKILKRKKRLLTKLRRIDKKILKQNSKFKLGKNVHDPFEFTETFIKDKLKVFVRTREMFFKNLHDAISTNYKRLFIEFDKKDIEKTCLQYEQKAIIASLESSMYQNVMVHILSQINSFTTQGLMCSVPIIKKENSNGSEHSLMHKNSINGLQTPRCNDSPLPTAKVIPRTITNAKKETNREYGSEEITEPVYLVKPQTQIEINNHKILNDNLTLPPSPIVEEQEIDTVEQGENVPMGTDTTSKGNSFEEEDLEELLKILEGTDDKEELRFDEGGDFSENEVNCESPPVKCSQSSDSDHSLMESWKNERYIFLYKTFKRCKQMQPSQFYQVRKSFGNYFGEDSDFEHEDSFNDKETFLFSCARRIIPTVVKFLKPYHKDHRILGGSYIFKNLVRRIADSLVDTNQYPSESQIESYVQKYFPVGKTYHNVTDVWCFMVDPDD